MKATRIIAVLLILFAVYNTWIALTFAMPLFLLWVALCGIAAIGIWRERSWSRWLVYGIAVLSIASVVANIVLLAINGWPLTWPSESLTALIPAVITIAVFVWMILATYRRFRVPV